MRKSSNGRNKSNCTNTLTMFMKPDVETVSRLNLFDIFEKENINTIYYETHNFISKTTDKLKKDSSIKN